MFSCTPAQIHAVLGRFDAPQAFTLFPTYQLLGVCQQPAVL